MLAAALKALEPKFLVPVEWARLLHIICSSAQIGLCPNKVAAYFDVVVVDVVASLPPPARQVVGTDPIATVAAMVDAGAAAVAAVKARSL